MNQAARMALVSLAIGPKTPDDRQRLADAIQRLTAEDPGCSVRTGAVSGQVVIGATGEQHLEVIVDRLKREFNVEAWVGRPEVVYRLALTRPADGEMKYTRRRVVCIDSSSMDATTRPGTGELLATFADCGMIA